MTPKGQAKRDHIEVLSERIAESAAQVDVSTHRLLTDIRAFDEAGGWHAHGARSCAAWLSWRIGLGLGPAREHIRVARRLGELPAIDAAMASGKVSYSKARAMTRVATDDNVDALLLMAREMTAAQLERACRLYRRLQPGDVDQRGIERRRYVRTRDTADGMVSIELRLRPDEAARVMKAIDVSAGTEPLVDGALALAETTLRGDADQRSPVEVTVHVDADSLAGHTDDATGISATTCRRLCCDAGLVPVIDDADGTTLDVGRRTRSIPAAIRRALAMRDGGCRFPGCTHTRFVDGHHVDHWIDGGTTALSNLVSLCHYHHKHVHELGFEVRVDSDGTFRFAGPDGHPIEATGDRARPTVARQRRPGLRAPIPGWDGTPVDYHAVVDMLWRADTPRPSQRHTTSSQHRS